VFQKVRETKFPPAKVTMYWDGDCSFCRFWTSNWDKLLKAKVQFEPYQNGIGQFQDLDPQIFKEASRLIEEDGHIYSGPDSTYRSLYLAGKYSWLHKSYQRNVLFRNFSDRLYQWIATNRGFCFRITKLLFGSDPMNLRPFWAIYLFVILFLILS